MRFRETNSHATKRTNWRSHRNDDTYLQLKDSRGINKAAKQATVPGKILSISSRPHTSIYFHNKSRLFNYNITVLRYGSSTEWSKMLKFWSPRLQWTQMVTLCLQSWFVHSGKYSVLKSEQPILSGDRSIETFHRYSQIRIWNLKTYLQNPPISPSFNTSILYRIGSLYEAKLVKLINIFRPRQKRRWLEHSSEESSYNIENWHYIFTQ